MGRCFPMVIVACVVCLIGRSYGQETTAVPFLLIPNSVEGNGMGGIAASLPSDDAISTFSNPAQLGLFSIDHYLSLSTYSPRTTWLPGGNGNNMSLDATALSAGLQLDRYFKSPVSISLGVGYSQVYLDLGMFQTGFPGTSTIISQFHAYDKAEDITMAVGIDYVVRFGMGYSFKSIESNLGPILSSQTGGPLLVKTPAHDFGMLLQIPFIDAASGIVGKPVKLTDRVYPLFDMSFGYAARNVGGEIVYAGQSDPLPRQAVLGWNLELGFTTRIDKHPWKLLTFTWAREASDVLVTTTYSEMVPAPGDTTFVYGFAYKSGLGDLRPAGNLVLGKSYGSVDLMKGWQVQLAECVYFRKGSYTGPGGLLYKTRGESFKLNGFLKLVASLGVWDPEYGWVAYLRNHFDFQYNRSTYTSTTNGAINGTTFSSINIVFK